jgi:hypothetical protein
MGGKKTDSAQSSGANLSQQSPQPTPSQKTPAKDCENVPKHWVGVRVEDEDGKLVNDVSVHCTLSDGEFDVDMSTAPVDKDGVFKTQKLYDPGQCVFSFPAVYDVEWWPKGEAVPTTFPNEQQGTLNAGDCVLSGADKAGFRNYHSVWDCADNAQLKQNYPNPNQQSAGTTFKGPAKKTKTVSKALDQAWTFVVRAKKPPKLSLILIDKDSRPLKDKTWELTNLAQKGTTGADGKIEVPSLKVLQLTAEQLKVTMKPAVTAPKPTPGTPPPGTDPPPYPPPIVVLDFKDKVPEPDYTAQVVTWDLCIGKLDPYDVHTGALSRLQNLGFQNSTDLAGNATADQEPQAIKAYGQLYSNAATTWNPIKEDLRDRHDNP